MIRTVSKMAGGLTMRAMLLAVGLVVVVANGHAAPVGSDLVRQAAEGLLARHPAFAQAEEGRFAVRGVKAVSLAGAADGLALYQVELAPRGYVLVGGDDRLPPVLAFSATSDLDLRVGPQNALRGMLQRDLASIRAALGGGASSEAGARVQANRAEWAQIAAEQAGTATVSADKATVSSSSILAAPIVTSQWSQWEHFNEQYPVDPKPGSGYGNRAPAGCMAVTGAQLVHFYQWPPYGYGSHVDEDANSANLIAGTFRTAFNAPIDWLSMQDAYDPWSAEPALAVDAVSDLIYKMGVAVNLDIGSYELGGSSASVQSLGRALNRCFFYDRGRTMQRSSDASAFDAALRSAVLAGRPTICSIPGHVVLVDGLSNDHGTDYYHMNYGLGGIDDGWYRTSGTPDGSLDIGLFGQIPAALPLLEEPGEITMGSGETIELAWLIPAERAAEVKAYRVREGVMTSTSLSDSADVMGTVWFDYAGAWSAASGGVAGKCYRKSTEIGDFPLILRDVIMPTSSTRFQAQYKAILDDDHIYVDVSTDRGASWQTLRHITGTGYDNNWHALSLDLGFYAGREIMLQVRYVFRGGSYYANGGFWLDNVSINGIQQMQWRTLADDLAADASTYTVGTRADGEYHFEVQARTASGWSAPTPFASIEVGGQGAIWAGSVDVGGGWNWVPWFGYMSTTTTPWVFHEQHGWLYPFGSSSTDLTFWDVKMNSFWWTTSTMYPYMYRFSDNTWLWYSEGSVSPRSFLNLSNGKWEKW